jgi:hypothetical protein
MLSVGTTTATTTIIINMMVARKNEISIKPKKPGWIKVRI